MKSYLKKASNRLTNEPNPLNYHTEIEGREACSVWCGYQGDDRFLCVIDWLFQGFQRLCLDVFIVTQVRFVFKVILTEFSLSI